jgi:hypothetical protein
MHFYHPIPDKYTINHFLENIDVKTLMKKHSNSKHVSIQYDLNICNKEHMKPQSNKEKMK